MNKNVFFKGFWILFTIFHLYLFVYLIFLKKRKVDVSSKTNIALFIPGVISGSPSYREMYDSLFEFKKNHKNLEIKVLEAGFNQSEWIDILEKLLTSKKYDFLITTNNAMQDIVDSVSNNYPYTKFIIFDSLVKNTNNQVYSVSYNVAEEAYILGYYVGLFLKEFNSDLGNVALIAGQEYPVMRDYIYYYFKKGILDVGVNSKVYYRVLGNWHDSNLAKLLSNSLIQNSGVLVILPIVGPAVEGVLSSVRENNIFAILFDSEDYLDNKENIIGSGITNQKYYVSYILDKALKSEISYGNSDIFGIKHKGVLFNISNVFYLERTSQKLKEDLLKKIEEVSANGIKINLEQN
ncbi:nucleoside-binding protein [Borreliella japonica]|uniref:Nucleoside-binding protein n=1 Tax=Borreliella japonica TaxID=34095 RepID=A0A1G4PI94_BORJA|nr:BMP family protein [Borreliella japonica]WKC88934.1 BMP family protein [Borreliella japonica]SCW31931.1 nucleoside-binding protein [Borreliella japonica]